MTFDELALDLIKSTDKFTESSGEYRVASKADIQNAETILKAYYENVEQKKLDYANNDAEGIDYLIRFDTPLYNFDLEESIKMNEEYVIKPTYRTKGVTREEVEKYAELLGLDYETALRRWKRIQAPESNYERVLDRLEPVDEAIEKHDTLNPKLWDGDKLKPEVESKLKEIVQKFDDNLKENGVELDVKDICIIGSNANYNYSPDSDIDLHIVADTSVYPNQEDLAMKVYLAYKSLFNNKYDPTINGVEAEIYVEPDAIQANSNGIYSLDNGWLREPEQVDVPEIDPNHVQELIQPYEDRYNDIINSDATVEDVDKLIDDIYLQRQQSIMRDGEFGDGNICFKEFRNRGYLQNLRDLKVELENKEMSLNTFSEGISNLYGLNEEEEDYLIPELRDYLKVGRKFKEPITGEVIEITDIDDDIVTYLSTPIDEEPYSVPVPLNILLANIAEYYEPINEALSDDEFAKALEVSSDNAQAESDELGASFDQELSRLGVNVEDYDNYLDMYKRLDAQGKEVISGKIRSFDENYSVVDLSTGDHFGDYESADEAEGKALRYAKDFKSTAAVVDDDYNVICGYTSLGRRINPKNESLDESVEIHIAGTYDDADLLDAYDSKTGKVHDDIHFIKNLDDNKYLYKDDDGVEFVVINDEIDESLVPDDELLTALNAELKKLNINEPSEFQIGDNIKVEYNPDGDKIEMVIYDLLSGEIISRKVNADDKGFKLLKSEVRQDLKYGLGSVGSNVNDIDPEVLRRASDDLEEDITEYPNGLEFNFSDPVSTLEVYLQWEGIIGYDWQIISAYEDGGYDGLAEYLDEEGIYGYTEHIRDILEGEPAYCSQMEMEDFESICRHLYISPEDAIAESVCKKISEFDESLNEDLDDHLVFNNKEEFDKFFNSELEKSGYNDPKEFAIDRFTFDQGDFPDDYDPDTDEASADWNPDAGSEPNDRWPKVFKVVDYPSPHTESGRIELYDELYADEVERFLSRHNINEAASKNPNINFAKKALRVLKRAGGKEVSARELAEIIGYPGDPEKMDDDLMDSNAFAEKVMTVHNKDGLYFAYDNEYEYDAPWNESLDEAYEVANDYDRLKKLVLKNKGGLVGSINYCLDEIEDALNAGKITPTEANELNRSLLEYDLNEAFRVGDRFKSPFNDVTVQLTKVDTDGDYAEYKEVGVKNPTIASTGHEGIANFFDGWKKVKYAPYPKDSEEYLKYQEFDDALADLWRNHESVDVANDLLAKAKEARDNGKIAPGHYGLLVQERNYLWHIFEDLEDDDFIIHDEIIDDYPPQWYIDRGLPVPETSKKLARAENRRVNNLKKEYGSDVEDIDDVPEDELDETVNYLGSKSKLSPLDKKIYQGSLPKFKVKTKYGTHIESCGRYKTLDDIKDAYKYDSSVISITPVDEGLILDEDEDVKVEKLEESDVVNEGAADEIHAHELKAAVADEIHDMLQNATSNLAQVIGSKIKEYNIDWCNDDGSNFSAERVETALNAAARALADDLFKNAPREIQSNESLEEDTVKQNGKWVNKGKDGTHGEFDTEEKADAQRKAMFANGYHEDLGEGWSKNREDLRNTNNAGPLARGAYNFNDLVSTINTRKYFSEDEKKIVEIIKRIASEIRDDIPMRESLDEDKTNLVYVELNDNPGTFVSKEIFDIDDSDYLFTNNIDNVALFNNSSWKEDLQELLDNYSNGYTVDDFKVYTHFDESLREDVDPSDHKAIALAEFEEVDLEDIDKDPYDDGVYTIGDSLEYFVGTEDEAHARAVEEVKALFDDMGLDAFTPSFQREILKTCIDEDAADEFVESELDYFKNDEPDEDMVNYLENLTDKLQYVEDTLGPDTFADWAKDKIDVDAVAEEAIKQDGEAHFIAFYDGNEVNLGNGLYAYRMN